MPHTSSETIEAVIARKRLAGIPATGLSDSYIASMDINDVLWLLGEYDRGNWPPKVPAMKL
jgi:hypothetical protein